MTQLPDDDRTLIELKGMPMNPLHAVKVRVTPRFLYFERGQLRSVAQQIPMAAIFDVDASQSMIQRGRQLGTVTIKVIRGGQPPETVTLEDMPEHRNLVAALNDISHQARMREKTQHIQYGQPQPIYQQPAQAAPASEPKEDVMAKLRQLGELRDAGIVSPEEFEAKKADLLSRL